MTGLFALALILGALIVYHHAFYPLLLKKLGSGKTQQADATVKQGKLPSIELVVPAYNEADFIAQKIENLCQLNYPRDLLRVTVIGDGCRDDTMEIARQFVADNAERAAHIELRDNKFNQGKVAVLNQAIAASSADIIALSDVSALISEDALERAAFYFQDCSIGVVNSCYRFAQYASPGEKAYWDYQSNIKRYECNTGSVIGAHGALYFIRRQLCRTLAMDTINDDFILPMQAVAQGYKAYQAPDIIATELEQVKPENEHSRRMRIGAGNLQQAVRLRTLLHPSFKGVAFNFFSGKVLRVLMPWCLMLFFALSLVLASVHWLFAFAAVGQLAFYSAALIQHVSKSRHKVLNVIYYFAAGHWYSMVGMFRYLTSTQTFKV